MGDVTRRLARFIVDSRWRDVCAPVQHEAVRAVVNWLGCALGGCRDEAVGIALAALREFAGPPQAALLGRPERLDILNAALINAISSNILDFDDTHLRTVIHPTVPVAAALTALAEHKAAGGAELLHALVLGIETECRIGSALLFGTVGVEQYGDACVADPRVVALRGKVTASGDASVGREQAQVRIDLAGGVQHELFVPHALGSLDNPLSDADLDAKFRVLAHQVLDESSAERLLGLCRVLPTLHDSGTIARESASQPFREVL